MKHVKPDQRDPHTVWEDAKPAPLSKLSARDTVIVDGGIDCIEPFSKVEVGADEKGELYVPCTAGRHYLNGQLPHDDDSDVLVGVRSIDALDPDKDDQDRLGQTR